MAMNPSSFHIANNLYIPVDNEIKSDFEQQYIRLRAMENRIYSDEELFHLPDIAPSHPHFKEWMIRKRSSGQLIAKLERKKDLLSILEVGCGNGWLSYQLSRIPGSRVIGLDVNLTELQQASRVFNTNSKLKFIYGDIRTGIINDMQFDVIVFAASIQYFSSVSGILNACLQYLYQNGEIHIIDSPFYRKKEVEAARNRTKEYYSGLGFPGMTDYYYHHCITELDLYDHRLLRNPFSIRHKFFGNNHPFPWICIKK
jgi:SAM-dependent methyltransferase